MKIINGVILVQLDDRDGVFQIDMKEERFKLALRLIQEKIYKFEPMPIFDKPIEEVQFVFNDLNDPKGN
jgi:hypothetical protein